MAVFLYLSLLAVSLILYRLCFVKKNADYFAKKGIQFVPQKPLISVVSLLSMKKSFVDIVNDWYYELRDQKVSGLFEFTKPMFVIRDPQLIKRITVKDFDFFSDRRVILSEDYDELFGKSLISMQGEKWKDMRSTLSPAFTGSKMRLMFDFVTGLGKQTVESLRRQIDEGREKDFEFKELATKITVDNIASCAFGIQVNSFDNPKNDFQRMASKLVDFQSIRTLLIFIGYSFIPWIMKYFKISFFDSKVNTFFQEAIFDTMKTREKNKIVRNDMIHLLLQAKKGVLVHDKENEEKTIEGFATVEESQVGKAQSKRKWTDVELAAQCFIFFFAGFDTVSTAMSFMGYELACNQSIQQKLYEEIIESEKELSGGQLTYEKLQGMKYMDQVVCEVLRKWPPAPFTDRVCVRDYEFEYDDKKFTIEKDIISLIPIWSIHHDPEYFSEPEKFDPERFSDENKHNIQEYTYYPFGIGPRSCIGSRFALMEVKSIFYSLLLNFKIITTPKTPIPVEFVKIPVGLKVADGIWVALEPRS